MIPATLKRLMQPKYIVFQDANEDRTSAICFVGHAPHVSVWNYLHRRNPLKFARALSAGYTYFKIKTKKFVATSSSSTLNLVPHEDDPKVLQEVLAKTTKLIVTDLGEGPDFGFLLGSAEDLLSTCFDQCAIFGEGSAAFQIQDSARPFKFDVEGIKGTVLGPEYLTYIENRLAA